ncbi:hypothetical protein [Rhodoferax sp.]|uniref:hypothetical protein n=1 Tax=Rhodoferax sp. TaxID=50421 RepID=UPI0027272F85|nr:hypothetical protein [Rhodoferax sp.]MDO9198963.1 hypothetical protein [Rhodoferax sp.]
MILVSHHSSETALAKAASGNKIVRLEQWISVSAMADSTQHPNRRNMLRVCSVCGAVVERKDCHKNRFGEYICRKCQAAVTTLKWHQRLRLLMKGMLPKFLLGLPIAVLALLALWALAVYFL